MIHKAPTEHLPGNAGTLEMFARNCNGFSGLLTPQSDRAGSKYSSRTKNRYKLAYVRKVGKGFIVGTKGVQDAYLHYVYIST